MQRWLHNQFYSVNFILLCDHLQMKGAKTLLVLSSNYPHFSAWRKADVGISQSVLGNLVAKYNEAFVN